MLLSDIAQLTPKLNKSTIQEKSLASFVPMACVSEVSGSIISEEEREIEAVLKGFTYFQNGDILVAKITPCFENGKIALAHVNHEHAFGSTEFHVLRPNATKVDGRYLFHFLRQPRIRIEGEKRMTGSGGQRRVPKSFLEELEILLPSLPEQRRIAAILDKAEALRSKRREAIAKLDQLLQSVFLEMFGDALVKPKAEVVPLHSTCHLITDGTHQSPTWVDSGIPFIFQSHVKPGSISLDVKKYISLDEYQILTARKPIEINDILYTIVGSYGNAAMVRSEQKFCFQRHIAHIKVKSTINPEFLEAQMNQEFIKKQADLRATGIAQKTLILKELKDIKIILPSIDAQNNFVKFYRKIRKSSDEQNFQLNKLNTFCESLNNKFFTH